MNKLTITFLLLAAMAFAKNEKLAADLPAADSGKTVEVIVQFNDNVEKNFVKKLFQLIPVCLGIFPDDIKLTEAEF